MLKKMINKFHVIMGMQSNDDEVSATKEDKIFMYSYYSTITVFTLFFIFNS